MNHRHLIQIIGFICCCTFIAGCGSQTKKTNEDKRPNLVGNDRDTHGCIASAGYQWSNLLKDCIRPFEKGIKLGSTFGDDAEGATYLVFNADSSKVEVFMPKEKNHPILTRGTDDDNQLQWISTNDPSLSVAHTDGQWHLSKGCTILFIQE